MPYGPVLENRILKRKKKESHRRLQYNAILIKFKNKEYKTIYHLGIYTYMVKPIFKQGKINTKFRLAVTTQNCRDGRKYTGRHMILAMFYTKDNVFMTICPITGFNILALLHTVCVYQILYILSLPLDVFLFYLN